MRLYNKHKDIIPKGAIYIGRGSPYGNPFVIGKDGTREEVIAKYEVYLEDKINKKDKEITEALNKLNKDSDLLCYCSPQPCHGIIIERLWIKYFNKKELNPMDDGITHINIYSRGKTKLGRALSNFADIGIEHPVYGHFKTIEGFWCWLKTGKIHDVFRNTDGVQSKLKAKNTKLVVCNNFQQEIKTALLLKIESHQELLEALKQSTLPLVHYYYYGSEDNCKVVIDTVNKWVIDYIEVIRMYLQGKAFKLVIAGSRGITDIDVVKKAFDISGIPTVQIVSGGARGVDKLGEEIATIYQIPKIIFNADWDKYKSTKGKNPAGMIRNNQMAKYGTALLAIWDGVSSGTKNMISEMEKLKKLTKVIDPSTL